MRNRKRKTDIRPESQLPCTFLTEKLPSPITDSETCGGGWLQLRSPTMGLHDINVSSNAWLSGREELNGGILRSLLPLALPRGSRGLGQPSIPCQTPSIACGHEAFDHLIESFWVQPDRKEVKRDVQVRSHLPVASTDTARSQSKISMDIIPMSSHLRFLT